MKIHRVREIGNIKTCMEKYATMFGLLENSCLSAFLSKKSYFSMEQVYSKRELKLRISFKYFTILIFKYRIIIISNI